jgi:hypothetical protein
MARLVKALPILFALIAGTLATLPTSYDVVWTTPGVNGSADSMPLGGGDIGINTWFEDGKSISMLSLEIKPDKHSPIKVLYLVSSASPQDY